MQLRDWREGQGWTLDRMAREMNLPGANPAATLQRWESGVSKPSAVMTEKIKELTNGAVTAEDMHEARLQHERRRAGMSAPEAAE